MITLSNKRHHAELIEQKKSDHSLKKMHLSAI